jgi:membrane carboxypeptidase/penicillin-binding protein PbpC
VYLMDPTLRASFQALPLRAAGAAGAVEWRVNGTRVGAGAVQRQVSWPLQPGEHEISARDSRGRTATATIRVK